MLATNPVTANLIKARELIADERNWLQGRSRDENDNRCSIGMIGKVLGVCDVSKVPEIAVLRAAALEMIKRSDDHICTPIIEINDVLGHAAVMRMFDRAIELSLA